MEQTSSRPDNVLRNARKLLALTALVVPVLAAAPEDGYRVLYDQVYARRSSQALKGNLYLPATAGPAPAVVMIHGGGWSSGKAGDMTRFAERVVKAGFAVFNVTYRLAPDHKFPAQLEDVRDAVRWLRTHSAEFHIDPDRIGAWGYSAGAHLAMLLGTVDADALDDAAPGAPSPRVAAVVAGAGPTDLREYPDNHYVVDLMPEDAGESLFDLASPIASVTGDDAATFLYHGRHDWIVALRNSVNMYRALDEAGVTTRLYELRFGHVFTYLFGGDAVDAGIKFLKTNLARHQRRTDGS